MYQAESIFKQVETFAGYGFNKSHAAGYALIAYQTSFLKANFPVEFMTASINYELNNVDKINRYLDDSKNMNIEILKPNINYSSSLFTIELNSQKKKSIRYGLTALKNVGMNSTSKIVNERKKRGKGSIRVAYLLNKWNSNENEIRNFINLMKDANLYD